MGIGEYHHSRHCQVGEDIDLNLFSRVDTTYRQQHNCYHNQQFVVLFILASAVLANADKRLQ